MPIEEQQVFLSKRYAEAIRYMDNANATLKTAGKENNNKYYQDDKYVKTACGTAYNGVLIALDAWFEAKGVTNTKKNDRKSVDFYKRNISLFDKKMADYFDTVYKVLHLNGYYDGVRKVKVIQSGFEDAYRIIDKIKPEGFVEVDMSKAKTTKELIGSFVSMVFGK